MKFYDDRLRSYVVTPNDEIATYSATFEVPGHDRLKLQPWETTGKGLFRTLVRRITAPTKLLLSERCDAFLAVYDAEVSKK